MGKCLTAGMIGFLLGMKSKECGIKLCMKQIKKQALRMLHL